MNIKIIHEPLFTYGITPGYEESHWDIDVALVTEEVWEAHLSPSLWVS
jgi:hypothetical protein